MDAGRSVVGESGTKALTLITGHRDDVGHGVAHGKAWGGIDILAVVTGGRDEDGIAHLGKLDRILQRLAEAAPAPAVVQNGGPHFRGVDDALGGIGTDATAARSQKFTTHQAHIPCHASHTRGVPAHAANGARDVRAVAVVVDGVARPGDGVDPVNVVDVAVGVVIDTGHTVQLGGIGPHVTGEVLVGVEDTGVDHRHDHAGGVVADVPAFRRVDVLVRHAVVLASVVQAPECAVGVARIVGSQSGVDERVGLGVSHQSGHLLQGPKRLLVVSHPFRRNGHSVKTGQAVNAHDRSVERLQRLLQSGQSSVGAQLHQYVRGHHLLAGQHPLLRSTGIRHRLDQT